MKKFFALLLSLAMVLALVACGQKDPTPDTPDTPDDPQTKVEYKVAMITDYGDITDQSFNQTTYEACKAFAEDNSIEFSYFKPAGDNTADRVAMIEKAVDEGFNVIVMPGYAFGGAIVEAAPEFPDVKFIALDVAAGDLLETAVAKAGETYDYPPENWDLNKYVDMSNVYCAVYQEELCGYMAVDAADADLGLTDVKVNYIYGGQFFGDADITAVMDTWYQGGTEVVFACGGGIYTSAVDAAKKVGAKVIGVDVDQAGVIAKYAGVDGMTVTSAMKGLYPATYDTLTDVIVNGNWDKYVGKIATLGLVSGTDPEANYVQIPMGDGTQWSDSFTQDDYKAMVKDMFDGKITVSNNTSSDVSAADFATVITVDDQGSIKG